MSHFAKIPTELEGLPVWHGLNIAMITQLYFSANWKLGYFCGHEIKPYQLATSAQVLTEKIKVSKPTALSILKNLEENGIISRECIGNKFSIITLLITSDGDNSGKNALPNSRYNICASNTKMACQ